MKNYKGKAIYNPSGKAGEYSYWACNFVVGCSNGCTYCYLKKGRGAAILGGDKPELKKCFKNESHALKVFETELLQNIEDLRKHGLFFTFTSDPMLQETIKLNWDAIELCVNYRVPVKILTKKADWVDKLLNEYPKQRFGYFKESPHSIPLEDAYSLELRKYIACGFTLTGHDELEPNASTNVERINAMAKLHNVGFKTFASIEPIVDLDSSWQMIVESFPYCDLFKIGIMSGMEYNKKQLINFITGTNELFSDLLKTPIYWKDSLLKQAGILREQLPENCVNRDYNLFK